MNYAKSNHVQTERSYGSYDQQQPMKTFSGQARWATEREVDHLETRVDTLEKQMNKQYPDDGGACGRCPESVKVCHALRDANARDHCLQMHDQCKQVCPAQK
jgi:hypothetical protein